MADIIELANPANHFDTSKEVLEHAIRQEWTRVMVIGISKDGFTGFTSCTMLELMISDLERMKHNVLSKTLSSGEGTSPLDDDDPTETA